MEQTAEKIEFQAEVKQVLDLVIHSLYTHKEIFLRELISNASDALDKRRYEALTRPELASKQEPGITLDPDKEKGTLMISDNGIGMNREDLIANIGTIAKSGTQEFLRKLKEQKGATAPELIGQFGVGFYSAFMVADEVTILTRKAGEASGWRWASAADGGYTIEPAECPEGTSLSLRLKKPEEGEADYSDPSELRRIVKKYSDFITYPIRFKAGGDPLNSMKAIWTKPEKDISPEEHSEFYKHLSHDWEDPLLPIRFSAEGASLRYDALLYLPSTAKPELFDAERRNRGIHFYVKRVFIMDDCRDLLPDYLRFISGVVDCADIALNVSRETMQRNRQIAQIRERLVRKTLDALAQLKDNEPEKYEKFWRAFGRILKEGFITEQDPSRLKDLVLFSSSADSDKLSTFADYVKRMGPEQKDIYYLTGESREALRISPHLEALKEKGYEVIFFTDPVDEFVVERVRDYEGKTLRSAAKGDLGLEGGKAKAKQEEFSSLLELLKAKLADYVKDVRVSARLTSSAACLVADEHGLSAQLEKLLRQNRQPVPENKRILEVNAEHPVLAAMKAMFDVNKDDPELEDYAYLLYGQAALTEGSPLPDPARYARLVASLMAKR